MNRKFSLIDNVIIELSTGLRTLSKNAIVAERKNPADDIAEEPLTPKEKKHSAALMRINHCGEVCAQALYQGQALTARSPEIAKQMAVSSEEENDHLAWCESRLDQLDSHTSYLNPFWYTGSLMLGIIAGIAGDKWSLGFVAETEHQVTRHLEDHLNRLPKYDSKSRAIVSQMCEDEKEHAIKAENAGGSKLPTIIQKAMQLMSKLMTSTVYHV